jgi:hypothetical protein
MSLRLLRVYAIPKKKTQYGIMCQWNNHKGSKSKIDGITRLIKEHQVTTQRHGLLKHPSYKFDHLCGNNKNKNNVWAGIA